MFVALDVSLDVTSHSANHSRSRDSAVQEQGGIVGEFGWEAYTSCQTSFTVHPCILHVVNMVLDEVLLAVLKTAHGLGKGFADNHVTILHFLEQRTGGAQGMGGSMGTRAQVVRLYLGMLRWRYSSRSGLARVCRDLFIQYVTIDYDSGEVRRGEAELRAVADHPGEGAWSASSRRGFVASWPGSVVEAAGTPGDACRNFVCSFGYLVYRHSTFATSFLWQ